MTHSWKLGTQCAAMSQAHNQPYHRGDSLDKNTQNTLIMEESSRSKVNANDHMEATGDFNFGDYSDEEDYDATRKTLAIWKTPAMRYR